jgi:uroporphyrinogen-III decarboxylase
VDELRLSRASLVTAGPEVVSCDLADAAALLDLRSGTYYTLNEVGAHVWSLMQQPELVSNICDDVERRYDVDAQRCCKDVITLLQALHKAGLVEIGSPASEEVSSASSIR